MSSLLKVARKMFLESRQEDMVKDFVFNLTDGSPGGNKDIISSLEKLIREMGFGESLRRISFIGSSRLIVYYGDDREARELHDGMRKMLRETKLKVTYKDLHVGASRAGVIFDFGGM